MKNATAFYLLMKDILIKNITAELEKKSEIILEEEVGIFYFIRTILRLDLRKDKTIVATCYDYELEKTTTTTLHELPTLALCQISDRFNLGGDTELVEIKGGFGAWNEAYYEISRQVHMIDSLDKPYGLVKKARQENGYSGLVELTTELTEEFQNIFGNELWIDKNFHSELNSFTTDKLHIGKLDEIVMPIQKINLHKGNPITADIDTLLNGKDPNMFAKCKALKQDEIISTLNLQKCVYFNATILENIYDAKQFKIKTMSNKVELINYSDVLSIKKD